MFDKKIIKTEPIVYEFKVTDNTILVLQSDANLSDEAVSQIKKNFEDTNIHFIVLEGGVRLLAVLNK